MRNHQGNTAMIAAAYKNHSKVVNLLGKNGADPNVENFDSSTPLILAARSNYHKIIYELLKLGANPNIHDSQGNYAITLCGRSGHMDCLKHLFAFHADIDVVDDSGHSAYASALNNNHREAQKALALRGASHVGISSGNIPKVYACYWFRGKLQKYGLSQKQTIGPYAGTKACDFLDRELKLRGSIVKLLDMISFYGYQETIKRLMFETFVIPGKDQSEALLQLQQDARNDLKDMHTKDYREHFRTTDEEEMEKNLPNTLRKFGADIPEEKKEGDLDLAAIAAEKTTKRQVHRAPKDARPEHVKGEVSLEEIAVKVGKHKYSDNPDVEAFLESSFDEIKLSNAISSGSSASGNMEADDVNSDRSKKHSEL
jgi:hypothetical protein